MTNETVVNVITVSKINSPVLQSAMNDWKGRGFTVRLAKEEKVNDLFRDGWEYVTVGDDKEKSCFTHNPGNGVFCLIAKKEVKPIAAERKPANDLSKSKSSIETRIANLEAQVAELRGGKQTISFEAIPEEPKEKKPKISKTGE